MRLIRGVALALLVVVLVAILLLQLHQRRADRASLALEGSRRRAAEQAVEELEESLGRLRRHLGRLEEENLAAHRRWREAARLLAGAEGSPEAAAAEAEGEEPSSSEKRERIRRAQAAVVELNRGLARAGHPRARFFAIGEVAADHLVDVSFHFLGREGIVSRALRLERLYLVHDLGDRVLRFFAPRGRICREGRWDELGEEGWHLELKGVPPRTWGVGQCPFLRRIPAPPPAPREESARERVERHLLRDRFNALFRESRGFQGRRYRLVSLGRLLPGRFGVVEILAYSPKGLLMERFRAGEMQVQELAGGGIRLLLREGFRIFAGGRQALPPAGYALHLPRAEPAAWRKSFPDRVNGRQKGQAD